MHTLHKPVSFMFATLNGLLQCQDLVLSSESVTTEVQASHIRRIADSEVWTSHIRGTVLV